MHNVHDTNGVNGDVMSQIAALPESEEPLETEKPAVLLGQRLYQGVAAAEPEEAVVDEPVQADEVAELEFCEDDAVPVVFDGEGPIRIARFTRSALELINNLPKRLSIGRDVVRDAALAGDCEQGIAQNAELAVAADKDWSRAVGIAEGAIRMVAPFKAAAQSVADRCQKVNAALPLREMKRSGSFREMMVWANLPAMIFVPILVFGMYLGAHCESMVTMLYVATSFPDFVYITLGGFDYSPAEISFALTGIFVIGPFVLFKMLLWKRSPEELGQFAARYRRFCLALAVISPVTFAWVIGVIKDNPIPELVNGVVVSPLTPGMTGYIIVAMFTMAATTLALSLLLQDAINQLFPLVPSQHPERAFTDAQLAHAMDSLASCDYIVTRSERVLKAAEAATKVFKNECRFALGSEESDVEARKQSAFLLPSRN